MKKSIKTHRNFHNPPENNSTIEQNATYIHTHTKWRPFHGQDLRFVLISELYTRPYSITRVR